MTLICGVARARPVCPGRIAAELEAVAAPSRHDGLVKEETGTGDVAALKHFSIGAFNSEPEPAAFGQRWRAVACGKLVDAAAIRGDLLRVDASAPGSETDAELVLHIIRLGRDDLLARLNGGFSAAVWDACGRKLTLVTDRLGIRILYYHFDARVHRLLFSSDLRGIADSGLVSFRPNWGACSNLLTFGHNLGSDTLFEGIRCVPPGSVVEWSGGPPTIRQYWSTQSIEIDHRIGRAEAVEGLADLFAQAMRRRQAESPGRTAVMLSGGLDSRRIAGQLHRLGVPFETYTVGWEEESPDPWAARRVAKALGVPHTFVPLPKKRLMRRCWPLCGRWVDYETKLHQWIVPLLDVLPAEVKINYDGLGGDIPANGIRRGIDVSPEQQVRLMRSGDWGQLARALTGPPVKFSFLAPRIAENVSWEAAVASVERELSRHGRTPNALIYFLLQNRTRRAVGPFSMKLLLRRCESFLPFLDNDLLDFTMRIPIEVRTGHPLRELALQKAFPALASIPTAVSQDSRGRKVGWQQRPLYRQERRAYFRHCLRKHYMERSWLFRNVNAGPRLLIDLVLTHVKRGHVSFVFSESHALFYEWVARYFSGGFGNL